VGVGAGQIDQEYPAMFRLPRVNVPEFLDRTAVRILPQYFVANHPRVEEAILNPDHDREVVRGLYDHAAARQFDTDDGALHVHVPPRRAPCQ